MRDFVRVTISAALVAVATFAAGQTARPLPPPPDGFKALPQDPSSKAMKEAGMADRVDAKKANANWPNCHPDPMIGFSYGWTASPVGDQIVEMMAKTPEDPVNESGGSRNEPFGRQRHKGGVLSWRKITTEWVGSSCSEDKVVTYDGQWVGFVSGKLIAISVNSVYGSKDVGQVWIDDYIGKMIAAVKASS